MANFSHPKLKILETFIHENKLRIGHLKGNSFFIRLKKVLPSDALKLEQALINLDKQGLQIILVINALENLGTITKKGLKFYVVKR